MEGEDGTWPTGQLVVGLKLGCQYERKLPLVTCWTLPSPKRMFPAPVFIPAECIFNDQQTGPDFELVWMATSFPLPPAGEKP